MRVKLGRGAVSVLLTGSRNGFADFGVGREAWWLQICRASLEFMVIVHRSWSQKHISNRRKRKRRKGRGTGGETKRGKGRGPAAKLKGEKGRGLAAKLKGEKGGDWRRNVKGKRRGLAAFALRWSSWMEQVVFANCLMSVFKCVVQVVFEKESNIKDEDEQDRTKMGYIIWWFGSGQVRIG
uniref:Uncharacterized protein n=1 Tax=Solanum tuberosum TaxID=4113 RepID=M1A794_SOLTU